MVSRRRRALAAPPSSLRREVLARAEVHARKRGLSRRQFLQTSSGMATLLLTTNELFGCSGNGYALPHGSELDEEAARARLQGNEFIFDVHTQHVSTERPWHRHNETLRLLAGGPHADCGAAHWTECYSRERYLRDVFLDSDTDLAVLAAPPGDERDNPLLVREMAETRALAERLHGFRRVYLQGSVLPNAAPALLVREEMERLRQEHGVCAIKLCTSWGPHGCGFFLDTDTGMATVQAARDAGVPRIAVHKGMPPPGTDPAYASARDLGPVAKAYPDVTFFVTHAGYDPRHREAAYDARAALGVNALIASLAAHGVEKNGNVYAELGATWHSVMRSPDAAAHVLGKLLVHLGEDRVLWGTDAIWYGCPQDQIEAFRAFEIGAEYQERFGYPALTPAIKAKILGLNAARAHDLSLDQVSAAVREDELARLKQRGGQKQESARRWRPTRREMFAELRRGARL